MERYYWLHLANFAWMAFLGYWLISARKLKTIQRREPHSERVVYLAFMVATYFLMFSDRIDFGSLGRRFVAPLPAVGATGVGVTVMGIAFAIWARWHLGENWSATVTLKEGHELIRSGPYGRIRHPIYTGMLLALAGTALALGEYRGLLSLVMAVACFYVKARKEEHYLVQEFGDGFREHVEHTGMFFPQLTHSH
jgi:protein-S-isoprenylcysteine O-methyltransferase Ste14